MYVDNRVRVKNTVNRTSTSRNAVSALSTSLLVAIIWTVLAGPDAHATSALNPWRAAATLSPAGSGARSITWAAFLWPWVNAH